MAKPGKTKLPEKLAANISSGEAAKAAVLSETGEAHAKLENPETPVKQIKSTPVWSDWKARPTVSLYHAICLVHNIHTHKPTVEALKKRKDPRTKHFMNHLNTLKLNQPFQDLLKSAIPDQPKLVSDETKIFLKDFIAWVKNGDWFGDFKPPEEFFKLEPPYPVESHAKEGNSVVPLAGGDAEPSSSDANQKLSTLQAGTMARMLLALAIKHYDYRPFSNEDVNDVKRPKVGTYGPIYKLCEQMGFSRPSEWETVKSVLLKASILVGEDELKKAVELYSKTIEKELTETK